MYVSMYMYYNAQWMRSSMGDKKARWNSMCRNMYVYVHACSDWTEETQVYKYNPSLSI